MIRLGQIQPNRSMMNFSYTVTPTLKQEIENTEITRKKILLELLSPSQKLQLRYNTEIERITASLRLCNTHLKKSQVLDYMSGANKQKDDAQRHIIEYKNAYDYIKFNWLLENKNVEPEDIKRLFSGFKNVPVFDEKELKTVLDFIQINPEHPIVQSALAVILFSELMPASQCQAAQITMVALLFLYKFGFDLRGFLNLEEFLADDISRFEELLKKSKQEKNISEFLEYFTQIVSLASEKAYQTISKRNTERLQPEGYFKLSDRQKEILTILERPGSKITNKKVQKLFGVSQITASRDLSGLATLGHVFSVGKGRSVYYTKL